MYFRENWCDVGDAYTCNEITNRDEWLAHKDVATDKATCDSACWPQNKWVCYGDGTTAPVNITSQAQWNVLKPNLPPTTTIVDNETDCAVPNQGKSWCNANFECGTISTWDDWNQHKNDTIADNCDDCYPKGKKWCDRTTFTCNDIASRQDYLDHKDAILDDCSTCYPAGQSWCSEDKEDCTAITDLDSWTRLRDTPGALIDDCQKCFPQGLYWCDSTKKCNEIETFADWKRSSKPLYKSSERCTKNCGDKKVKAKGMWIWLLLIILILLLVGLGIFFYRKKARKRS